MGRKSVCLDCQKAHNNSMDYEVPMKEVCPDCGSKMYLISHHFRPPKKTDDKKWAVVRFLIEKGFNYDHVYRHVYGGIYLQVGKYPETMKEAEEFARNFSPNRKKILDSEH